MELNWKRRKLVAEERETLMACGTGVKEIAERMKLSVDAYQVSKDKLQAEMNGRYEALTESFNVECSGLVQEVAVLAGGKLDDPTSWVADVTNAIDHGVAFVVPMERMGQRMGFSGGVVPQGNPNQGVLVQ